MGRFLWKFYISGNSSSLPIGKMAEKDIVVYSHTFYGMVQQRGGITDIWPRGYKNIFMLNAAKHEILPTHKISKCQQLLAF